MIIALHGKKRVGKDEALKAIKESLDAHNPGDLELVHESFARSLKKSACASIDLSPENLERFKDDGYLAIYLGEDDDAVETITGRQYLQKYGTEAHRQIFGDDFWVDQVLPEDLDHRHKCIVITDVRFENEAQRVLELGGEIWHILRPEIDDGDTHASEQPLPDEMITVRIMNGRDLDQYHSEVKSHFQVAKSHGVMV